MTDNAEIADWIRKQGFRVSDNLHFDNDTLAEALENNTLDTLVQRELHRVYNEERLLELEYKYGYVVEVSREREMKFKKPGGILL